MKKRFSISNIIKKLSNLIENDLHTDKFEHIDIGIIKTNMDFYVKSYVFYVAMWLKKAKSREILRIFRLFFLIK